MSLIQRHPGKIDEMWERAATSYRAGLEEHRAEYPSIRRPQDPESFDEFRLQDEDKHIGLLFAKSIQLACDMNRVGIGLNSTLIIGAFKVQAIW